MVKANNRLHNYTGFLNGFVFKDLECGLFKKGEQDLNTDGHCPPVLSDWVQMKFICSTACRVLCGSFVLLLHHVLHV